MTIDQNYQYLPQIFLYMLRNSQFRDLFKSFAPEIQNDIESAAFNPDCTCRTRVQNYINENREKCHLFFTDFINTNPGAFDLNEFAEYISPPKNYSGHIEKVKISEWNEFVKKLVREKANFSMFSTSKIDDEYINVFFI